MVIDGDKLVHVSPRVGPMCRILGLSVCPHFFLMNPHGALNAQYGLCESALVVIYTLVIEDA